jgi:hypothetical protein
MCSRRKRKIDLGAWKLWAASELRQQGSTIVLQRVEPFLGNDRKPTGSRGNSERATVEVLLKTVFYTVVRAEEL